MNIPLDICFVDLSCEQNVDRSDVHLESLNYNLNIKLSVLYIVNEFFTTCVIPIPS